MHDGPVVVVTGGGTGGHLYPALAIADALRARRPDTRVLFMGTERGIEARVLPERREWHELLPVRGFDRSHPVRAWRSVVALVRSLARAARLLREHRPEVVVVTGGYAAAPAGMIAALRGIPLVLQEQNSVPGWVTRALSRWARRAYVAYPEVEARLPKLAGRVVLTGNPVRVGNVRPRTETRAAFGIPTDARLVVVAGGSQGSLALNEAVSEIVRRVSRGALARPADLHLLWVSGHAHTAAAARVLSECGSPAWVRTVPYLDDMPSVLAAADLAVSRAGAMSTAELLIRGLPAILVPLPTAAADHQTANARSLEKAGAALVAPQAELTPESLWARVTELLGAPERLARMQGAALALARPHAADQIAADIETLLPGEDRAMNKAVDLRALAKGRPVHFMGVGGAGMRALAELLVRTGGRVSGCDQKDGSALADLRRLGAEVRVGHDAAHVAGAAALVITSAVPKDHPEVAAARAAGIPVLKRAEALGAWVASGKVVAVAGTHGKTTTTAMTTEVLARAGLNPTGLVGGRVAAWDGNLRFGSRDLYVVEADEYDRSFHQLTPDIAIVTNVEADHLDVYGDYAGVRAGFATFLDGVRPGGRVIACADDHGAASLLARVAGKAYTYGTSAGAMLRAVDVTVGQLSTRATVIEDGARVGALTLRKGGRHNLLNALAAAAAARTLGVEWIPIREALADFAGVARRFERLGEAAEVVVIDDYAHHPTEISATLATARASFPGSRLVVAFQPHLYSRTRDFATEFGRALAAADVLWITDVFPAREAPLPGITGETIVRAARGAGAEEVRYHPALATLPEALADDLRPGDVLIAVGAGSIETVGRDVLSRLGEVVHA